MRRIFKVAEVHLLVRILCHVANEDLESYLYHEALKILLQRYEQRNMCTDHSVNKVPISYYPGLTLTHSYLSLGISARALFPQ